MGGYFINDNSGALGLNVNKILLSSSASAMFRNNLIRIGIQPGFVYRLYNNNNMTLPLQFNEDPDYGGFFDRNIQGGESGLGERSFYFTLNMGATWTRKYRNYTPTAGFSWNNVNRPRDSFQKHFREYHIPFKHVYFGSVKIDANQHISITPVVMYMRQRRAVETVIGVNAGYNMGKNMKALKGLNAGAYFRKSDWLRAEAMIVAMGFDVMRVHAEVSYDINVSGLSEVSNYRGAFEIALIFTGLSTINSKYTIPCDRY